MCGHAQVRFYEGEWGKFPLSTRRSIYVKSEKSAHRVMKTIMDYIESKLKLKVNRTKSKVSRPKESTLLGFSFYRGEKGWEIRIAPKSLEKIKKKIKEKTKRNDPVCAKEKIKKMEAMIRGWVNYFSIAKAKSKMKELDELVRTRLRMGIWKQWKRIKTKVMNLQKLGISKQKAYEWGNSRKGFCRVAHSPILCRALNNDYFATLHWFCQLLLLENGTPNKVILTNRRVPDRYARWCERTVREIIPHFLLDFFSR
jgi:RNA-directed DNA polymerase